MKKYIKPMAKFHALKSNRSLLGDASRIDVGQDPKDSTGNAFSKSASFSFDEDGE